MRAVEESSDQRTLGERLGGREKFLLLNALMLVMFVSSLDASIVSTAMPRILADLGGFDMISWVFTVYLLASTVVVPIFGKLSDMFGRKPFIIAGIFLFVASSAACGAAPNMLLLIVARGAQGVAGGMLVAAVFATMGDLFNALERAKYMGYFFATFTVASISGPTIGGLLTDGPGWRWCFFINLPIGALATIAIAMTMPNGRRGGRLSSIDFGGAALLCVSTIALLLALVWSDEAYGWGSAQTIGLFAVAAVGTIAFIRHEIGHPEAILPMSLFRNRVFVQANLLMVLSAIAVFGSVQYLPTFIQTALGASATASGIVSTPQAIGFLVSSIGAGQLVARTRRFKYPVIAGAIVLCVACFLLHLLNENTSELHIAALMVLLGVGTGLAQPMMSVLIQSSVPRSQIGVSTSARQFFFQVSSVVAIAVFGLLFATTYQSSFTSHLPREVRTELPAAAANEFEDPTLVLDASRFAQVQSDLRQVPNGERMLTTAITSQKKAVSEAIDTIFLCATVACVLVLVVAATFTNAPLQATYGSDEELAMDRMGSFEPVH
jgi:EmrB/QacA subfamily drug resistance transporter